jgi:membrane dipeptidase
MHSDISCEVVRRHFYGEKAVLDRVFYPALRAGGVDALWVSTPAHISHYPSYQGNYLDAGMRVMDAMLGEIEACSGHFLLATTATEVEQAKRQQKIAVLLGFEGAEPIESELGNLRNFYRLGLREVQLTWNYRNNVCDGIYEPRNAGLTEFGRQLIHEMNRLGMLIDTSHINSRGLEEVLGASAQPTYMSHVSARALVDHPRNITDEQARAIAEKGGVIGVCFLPQFVAEKDATVEHVLDHLDHFVNLVGSEHVGLGPDFIDYCLEVMRGALKGMAYDSGETFTYPKDAEDATKLLNITRGMVARGYTDEDIENVLGRSMLRLMRRVVG